MTARDAAADALGLRWLMDDADSRRLLDAYRAEVLTEEAAELKAHCLVHNRFAATGFADCPCRVADELLRRVKVAGRGK